uniref:Dolichyldiphosphatase 1 n=1 Tax=Eptatretus burgeri TaxID=7764 RepID=A0A8C4QWY7_EPTBU
MAETCALTQTASKELKEGEWRPISLTHVQYPEGDLLGQFLAYCSLFPLAIFCCLCTLAGSRRDLHTICLLVGMLSNEAVNYLLKHWLQERRPCTEVNHTFHTEYGLPSNHAQFIWFFCMYSLLFLYMRLRVTGRPLWRLLLVVVLLLIAVSVSYSRVYLLYHTSRQVCCGIMVGVGMAVAWFAFTQLILTPLFPCISAWWVLTGLPSVACTHHITTGI